MREEMLIPTLSPIVIGDEHCRNKVSKNGREKLVSSMPSSFDADGSIGLTKRSAFMEF